MHKLDTDNWLHSWVPGRAAKEEQLVARRGVLVAKGYRATVNVQPCRESNPTFSETVSVLCCTQTNNESCQLLYN